MQVQTTHVFLLGTNMILYLMHHRSAKSCSETIFRFLCCCLYSLFYWSFYTDDATPIASRVYSMDESMDLYNYLMGDWLSRESKNPVKRGTHISQVMADARVFNLQNPSKRVWESESFFDMRTQSDCFFDLTTVKNAVNYYISNTIAKFCKRGGDWDHIADLVIVLQDVQIQADAMVLAAMYSEKRPMQILLNGGCDVNARSAIAEYENMTPLLAACGNGSSDTIKMLLEAGADAKACDEARGTCLHHVMQNRELNKEKKYEIIELLKQNGADILSENERGDQPIYTLLKSMDVDIRDLKIVKALLHDTIPFENYKREIGTLTSLFLSAHVHSLANVIMRQGRGSEVKYGSDRFQWFSGTITCLFGNNTYHTSLLTQMFAEQFYVTGDLMRNLEETVENQPGPISVAQLRILQDILQGSWATVWNLHFITDTFRDIVEEHRVGRKLVVCMGLHWRLNESSLLRLLNSDLLLEICANI